MERKKHGIVLNVICGAALSGAASGLVSLLVKLKFPAFNPVFAIAGSMIVTTIYTIFEDRHTKEANKKGYI